MGRIIIGILFISNLLLANVGYVSTLTGNVELKRNKEVMALQIGMTIEEGDIIISKAKSSIGIVFDDGTSISLEEKSIFVINKFVVDPSKKEYDVDVELTQGKALFESGKVGKLAPQSVKFRIPEGIIGIRGTKFVVEVS